jgi:hypothetical protein
LRRRKRPRTLRPSIHPTKAPTEAPAKTLTEAPAKRPRRLRSVPLPRRLPMRPSVQQQRRPQRLRYFPQQAPTKPPIAAPQPIAVPGCGTIPVCHLVKLKTNGETNVFNATGRADRPQRCCHRVQPIGRRHERPVDPVPIRRRQGRLCQVLFLPNDITAKTHYNGGRFGHAHQQAARRCRRP